MGRPPKPFRLHVVADAIRQPGHAGRLRCADRARREGVVAAHRPQGRAARRELDPAVTGGPAVTTFGPQAAARRRLDRRPRLGAVWTGCPAPWLWLRAGGPDRTADTSR